MSLSQRGSVAGLTVRLQIDHQAFEPDALIRDFQALKGLPYQDSMHQMANMVKFTNAFHGGSDAKKMHETWTDLQAKAGDIFRNLFASLVSRYGGVGIPRQNRQRRRIALRRILASEEIRIKNDMTHF